MYTVLVLVQTERHVRYSCHSDPRGRGRPGGEGEDGRTYWQMVEVLGINQ